MPTSREAAFIHTWKRHGSVASWSLLEAQRLGLVVDGNTLTPRGEDLLASAEAEGFDPDACPDCNGTQLLANLGGGSLYPVADWTGPVIDKRLDKHIDARSEGVPFGTAIRCNCYVAPCKTCGGTGSVPIIGDFSNPCPTCAPVEGCFVPTVHDSVMYAVEAVDMELSDSIQNLMARVEIPGRVPVHGETDEEYRERLKASMATGLIIGRDSEPYELPAGIVLRAEPCPAQWGTIDWRDP